MRSMSLVGMCRCVWVIGTSAEVAPASALPKLAASHGAKLVEINLTNTSLSQQEICEVSLFGPQETIVPQLVEEMLAQGRNLKV